MYNVWKISEGKYGYSVQEGDKKIIQESAPGAPGNFSMTEIQATKLAILTEKKMKTNSWFTQDAVEKILADPR